MEWQRKYKEAEPLYRRAVKITKASLGKDHPDYSIRLDGLAGLLQKQVRGTMPGSAILASSQAASNQADGGVTSPTVLQGKYEEAEPLYRLAMEITGATVSENHPDFAIRLDGLAGLLVKQVHAGRRAYTEAMTWLALPQWTCDKGDDLSTDLLSELSRLLLANMLSTISDSFAS